MARGLLSSTRWKGEGEGEEGEVCRLIPPAFERVDTTCGITVVEVWLYPVE